MSKRVVEKYLEKHILTLESEWIKEKEEEIVTLHNAFADVIEQQKPHPSTLLTVLRIIEHETIQNAFEKMKSGKTAEEVLKQRATKKTKP